MSFFSRIRGDRPQPQQQTSPPSASAAASAPPPTPAAASSLPPSETQPAVLNPRRQPSEPSRDHSPRQTSDDGGRTIAELRSTIQFLEDEVASRERALKRVENANKDTLRAKERQIVEQGQQLRRFQDQTAQLEAQLRRTECQLEEEKRRVTHAEGQAVEGHESTRSVQQRLDILLRNKEQVIVELTQKVTQQASRDRELTVLLEVSDKRRIELEGLLAAQTARSLALTDTIEQMRRNPRRTTDDPNASLSSDAAGNATADPTSQSGPASPVVPSPSAASSASAASGFTHHAREASRLEGMVRAKDKQIVSLSNDVVRLRAELATKVRAVDILTDDKTSLTERLSTLERSLDDSRSNLESTLMTLGESTEQLSILRRVKAERDEMVRSLQAELSAKTKELTEVRSRETSFAMFRQQHVDCQSAIVEKDLRIFQQQTALDESKALLDRMSMEQEQLQEQLRTAKRRLENVEDVATVEREKEGSRRIAVESDLVLLTKQLHDMEARYNAKAVAHEGAIRDLADIRALREQERETWRKRSQLAEEQQAQHRQAIQKAEEQHAKRERELVEVNERLTREVATGVQSRRELDAQVQQLTQQLRDEQARLVAGGGGAAAESSKKNPTSSLQRVSLELEEYRQKYARLHRDYQNKVQDNELLLRRLKETEEALESGQGRGGGAGGGDDGVSASGTGRLSSTHRRLIGMLECLSIELCSQLAKHLRSDYFRDGLPLTIPLALSTFRLEETDAVELITTLSRIMIMVRLGRPIKEMCQRFCVKEASIRRIVTTFVAEVPQLMAVSGGDEGAYDEEGNGGGGAASPTKVGEGTAAVAQTRRDLVIAGTPCAYRFNYSGSERLTLLLCALRGIPRGAAARNPKKGVARLAEDMYVLCLVCSYLPLVLRGSCYFAAHSLTYAGGNRTTPIEGHTTFTVLEPRTRTFRMFECSVTPTNGFVVEVTGSYRSGFSFRTGTHVKIQLRCEAKREGVATAPARLGGLPSTGALDDLASAEVERSAPETAWRWTPIEALGSDSAFEIVYSIQHEEGNKREGLSPYDGKVLSAETQGVQLREVSHQEASMLLELYSGTRVPKLEDMLRHRSWDVIPPPLRLKRKKPQ